MKQSLHISLMAIILALLTGVGGMAQAQETEQKTVLVTGANRGIGLALAKTFRDQGYKVIATARKPERAAALQALEVQVEALDVADPASVAALAKKLQQQAIDILFNNAGVYGHTTDSFSSLDIEQLPAVFNINSLGALRVTQALLPNLQRSAMPVVASMSSRMGSIGDNSRGGSLGYRASKTALNSLNKSLSLEFASSGFVFVVLHPGWVQTDMTSGAGNYTSSESAVGLVNVIAGLTPEDNGRFFDLNDQELPW